MQHTASSYRNLSLVSVPKGDTLKVVLHYEDSEGFKTSWSFDNFDYQPNLTLDTIDATNEVLTFIFTAVETGEVELALTESSVLGLPGANEVSTYRLMVKVV